jgi:predicted adenine nucleotide alpha hydrolase (AANH) superfamily ATPase
MKILLHTCCAPCTIYPIQILRENHMDAMGYFFKSNIHPYTECRKRLETLEAYAQSIELKLIVPEEYNLEHFLQNVAFRESDRCRFCYHWRLKSTALLAKRGKFDCFSSTLLYSRYQDHDQIRSIGESIGKSVGIRFYYHDFREGWNQGVEDSKRMGMYRQQYCGCIYSERDRYYRKPKTRPAKG